MDERPVRRSDPMQQGAPPMEEVPQVVGLSVHLTFAQRAYALAAWFNAPGCIVVMGGLHALPCRDEVLGAQAAAGERRAAALRVARLCARSPDNGQAQTSFAGVYLPSSAPVPPWK